MQDEEKIEIEARIQMALEYANERQPIRFEVYIRHIKYLKNKIKRLENELNLIKK